MRRRVRSRPTDCFDTFLKRQHSPHLFYWMSLFLNFSILLFLHSLRLLPATMSKLIYRAFASFPLIPFLASTANAASTYQLDAHFAGHTFFDSFDFFTVSPDFINSFQSVKASIHLLSLHHVLLFPSTISIR